MALESNIYCCISLLSDKANIVSIHYFVASFANSSGAFLIASIIMLGEFSQRDFTCSGEYTALIFFRLLRILKLTPPQ